MADLFDMPSQPDSGRAPGRRGQTSQATSGSSKSSSKASGVVKLICVRGLRVYPQVSQIPNWDKFGIKTNYEFR